MSLPFYVFFFIVVQFIKSVFYLPLFDLFLKESQVSFDRKPFFLPRTNEVLVRVRRKTEASIIRRLLFVSMLTHPYCLKSPPLLFFSPGITYLKLTQVFGALSIKISQFRKHFFLSNLTSYLSSLDSACHKYTLKLLSINIINNPQYESVLLNVINSLCRCVIDGVQPPFLYCLV